MVSQLKGSAQNLFPLLTDPPSTSTSIAPRNMSSLRILLARLCQFLIFFLAWLLRCLEILAQTLEPIEHAPALPVSVPHVVVTEPSTDIMGDASSEVKHAPCSLARSEFLDVSLLRQVDQDPRPRQPPRAETHPAAPKVDTPRRRTHAQKSKHHVIPGYESPRLSDASQTTTCVDSLPSPVQSECSPSVYNTPSFWGTISPSPLASPFSSPKLADALLQQTKSPPPSETLSDTRHIQIGNLGKRRGFKGTPLQTSAAGRNLGLGLFSPTNAHTNTPKTLVDSPSTPFSLLTSVKSPLPCFAKPAKSVNAISQDLQDTFNEAGPFGVAADSFFSSLHPIRQIPAADLYDFGACVQNDTMSDRQMPKTAMSLANPQHVKPTLFTTMKTTIYDTSVCDMPGTPPAMASRKRAIFRTSPISTDGESINSPLDPPASIEPEALNCVNDHAGIVGRTSKSSQTIKPSATLTPPLAHANTEEGSFYVSDLTMCIAVPTANLYDFGIYCDIPTKSVSANSELNARTHESSTFASLGQKTLALKTNIDDLGVYTAEERQARSRSHSLQHDAVAPNCDRESQTKSSDGPLMVSSPRTMPGCEDAAMPSCAAAGSERFLARDQQSVILSLSGAQPSFAKKRNSTVVDILDDPNAETSVSLGTSMLTMDLTSAVAKRDSEGLSRSSERKSAYPDLWTVMPTEPRRPSSSVDCHTDSSISVPHDSLESVLGSVASRTLNDSPSNASPKRRSPRRKEAYYDLRNASPMTSKRSWAKRSPRRNSLDIFEDCASGPSMPSIASIAQSMQNVFVGAAVPLSEGSCSDLDSPRQRRKSGLRPLVLPMRVANRASIAVATDQAPAPCSNTSIKVPAATLGSAEGEDHDIPGNRRSRRLDDIIALLDASVSDGATGIIRLNTACHEESIDKNFFVSYAI